MFKKIIITLILIVFALPALSKESINYDKLSDDLKFNNANILLKLGRQKVAMEEFNEYLEIYSQGNHRKEALKKIAKIYNLDFQYVKALKVYLSLYEEFSFSEDGVFAYFNAAICYDKMGYTDKAVNIYKEIIKNYSNSTYAHKAMIQLDLLNILKNN